MLRISSVPPEPLGQATSWRLQDLPTQLKLTLPSSSDWSPLMPTQLQAPGKSGVVSKRDQELKPRRDMLADANLPQRPQVLGLEEQDVSREALCLIEETELTDAGGCVGEEGWPWGKGRRHRSSSHRPGNADSFLLSTGLLHPYVHPPSTAGSLHCFS